MKRTVRRAGWPLCWRRGAPCLGALSTGLAQAEAQAAAPGLNPWNVVMGLLAVLVLILALAWLLRRVQQLPLGGHQQLRVSASVQVGVRERVVLVRAGDTQLLLGVAPGQVNLLHRFDEPLPEPSAPQPDFARTLQRLLGRGT